MSASEPNAATDAAASRYVRQSAWTRFRRYPAANIVVLYGVFLLTLIIIGLVVPSDFRFLASGNLGVLFQTIPTLGILSLGVGMLMISGEFDLSVAGVYTLAPYLMGLSLNEWSWPLWAAVLLALFVGLVVGIVNGLITTKLVIPSFIATLGMMFFLRGVVRFFSSDPKSSSSEQVSIYPGETFEAVLTGQIAGPLYAQFLWFIFFAILAYFFLNRHRLGNHFLSVGGNREAAIAVGVNANHVKRIGFVICSVGAAIAGTISATRVNAIIPAQTLTGLELQAIAACVVGGVFLFGGRGTVLGICLGVALILTVDNLLILLRAPGVYLQGFVGAIVIIAVIVNAWFARRVGGQQD
jgi:simple sugar transport system permease protein